VTLRVLHLSESEQRCVPRFHGFPASPDYAWQPACGGTETPFKTRTGRTLHYLWNRSTGVHAYYDVDRDLFLTNEEAEEALGR
jgi:hypothetical protein